MSAVVSFPAGRSTQPSPSGALEGWSARLERLDFFDLVQLLLLARESRAVWVRSCDNVGLLVFREGQLVHASTVQAHGVRAFLEISTWRGGVLEDVTSEDLNRFADNVALGTSQLLLEAARMRDEGAAATAALAQMGPGWPPAGSHARERLPGGETEPATHDGQGDMARRLAELTAGDEVVEHASLVRPEAPSDADLPDWLRLLWPFLAHALRHYPRPGPVRLLLEDRTGAAVLASLGRGRMLATCGAPGIRVGAVAYRCSALVLDLLETTEQPA